jgi:Cof subfamily protein (haloacid dehalogenase superfamily)
MVETINGMDVFSKDIKAVFFDIDGTLVSFKTHKVAQSTIDAVRKLRGKGVKVFIATGRPRPFIDNLGELEYDGIISANGASCRMEDGTVVHSVPVDKSDLKRLMDYCKDNPIPIAFATDEGAFFNMLSPDVMDVFSLLHIPLPQIYPIERCLDVDVVQVIAFFNPSDEAYMMNDVLKGCDAYRWHPAFADVIAKGNSKSTGIDAVLNYYGMNLSNALAFGDGGNDIPMLRHVPCSVAMGNASDEVKRHARYVTASVDDDGIAEFLTKTGLI